MSLRSEEHSGVDTINNQEEDPRRVMKEQSRSGRRSSNLFKDDSLSGTTSFMIRPGPLDQREVFDKTLL